MQNYDNSKYYIEILLQSMRNNDGFYLMVKVRPGFPEEVIIYLVSNGWAWVTCWKVGGRASRVEEIAS